MQHTSSSRLTLWGRRGLLLVLLIIAVIAAMAVTAVSAKPVRAAASTPGVNVEYFNLGANSINVSGYASSGATSASSVNKCVNTQNLHDAPVQLGSGFVNASVSSSNGTIGSGFYSTLELTTYTSSNCSGTSLISNTYTLPITGTQSNGGPWTFDNSSLNGDTDYLFQGDSSFGDFGGGA